MSVIYFGIDYDEATLDPGVAYRFCGPGGTLEVPDDGWPYVGLGNSVAFGSPISGEVLFPFYVFRIDGGTDGSYFGTAANPTGGYAAFVDDSNPPVVDDITRFGTIRWHAAGDNDCPGEEPDGAEPQLYVTSESEAGVDLTFTLSSLALEPITVGERDFVVATIVGGGLHGDIGKPAIPAYTRLIAVPATAEVTVTAEGHHPREFKDMTLLPMQSYDDHDVFAIDDNAYAYDGFGGEPIVEVSRPAIFGSLRVVAMTIRPLKYNPGCRLGKLAREIRIRVTFEEGSTENILVDPAPQPSGSFESLYQSCVVNYPPAYNGSGALPGRYVIICPDNAEVIARLEPLIEWRQRKGQRVHLATTTETGTVPDDIQAYLRGLYADPETRPEYVCLAGDADGPYAIQTKSYGVGYGDHHYALLDGDDLFPEAHIGRLSFGDLPELERIVSKVIAYETSPPLQEDPEWFRRACVVGDPSQSGPSTVMVQQWLKDRLLEIGYAEVDTVFGEPFVPLMLAALNRGDTIFSYRGYQGMSGWTTGNIWQLTNFGKLPFCVIPTCASGEFANGGGNACRSEAFLRAPAGGIGAIGTCTAQTHTVPNNCMSYGTFHGLLWDGQTTMGAAMTRGKLELLTTLHSSDGAQFCYYNNLMGGPAVDVWTDVPGDLVVSHPATLSVGANSATVTVLRNGLGEEGALVCLWKGAWEVPESYSVGLTDATGAVELPVTLLTEGSLRLTVTKHNSMPYMAQIPVSVSSEAYLAYESAEVDDDGLGESNGNGDGAINPSESVELSAWLHNHGSEEATGVTAALSSTDGFARMLDADEAYPDVQAGGSCRSLEDYGFYVEPRCPDGHLLRFGLDITSEQGVSHSLIELPVIAPRLSVISLSIDDEGGDGILEPGESATVAVELQNEGHIAATGVEAQLYSQSSSVLVTDGDGVFGDIPVGETGENEADRFGVVVDPEAFLGQSLVLRLFTTYSAGIKGETTVLLPIGITTPNDPTGPDAYGYYAFDDTDVAYPLHPVYDWVEADPAYGGLGTSLGLVDLGIWDGQSVAVDLPFPFSYYGEVFDGITICSNGWIKMGYTNRRDYQNWRLPSAGGPDGIICAFWEDLATDPSGDIVTWYDPENHRFVVEWSRLSRWMQDPPDGLHYEETFEVILYDPAYHATAWGNGLIDMQYMTITDVDPDPHGTWATVGVESPDGTIGLTYKWDRTYEPGSSTIQAGRAIRFGQQQTSAVLDSPAPSTTLSLSVRPNPCTETCAVVLGLPAEEWVSLGVYDCSGRLIRHLINGRLDSGRRLVMWDGRDEKGSRASAGVYLMRLSGPSGQREASVVVSH